MVVGVDTGFTRTMEMRGTGYRASVAGKELTLNVGYSNPRILEIPEGVKVAVEKNTTLKILGYDKVRAPGLLPVCALLSFPPAFVSCVGAASPVRLAACSG